MARGSIWERPEVRKDSWTIQVYISRDPGTGHKRYHSEAVRGTKVQAQRRLPELLHQLDSGTFTEPSALTVGEYLEQWYRGYVQTHARQRTQEGYRGILDCYLFPKLGSKALQKLSPKHVQEMESALLRQGEEKAMVCPP